MQELGKGIPQNQKLWRRALPHLLFLLIGAGLLYLFYRGVPPGGIKRYEEDLLGRDGSASFLTLADAETEKVFDSAIFKAQVQFNAIAPHWQEENVPGDFAREMFVRTSLDGHNFTDWMEIESLGPLRDNEPRPNRIYPEVPLLVEGKYFQYRFLLKRANWQTPAPKISDLKVTYIDSRTSKIKKVNWFRKVIKPSLAAEQGPTIVSRAGWGSPDPYGNLFKGTAQYWDPSYVPVTQVFLHHTVFTNQTDPAAAIRAIWEYHTYTRGWGDIGYNYLVDQNGTTYEGRFGGDNAVAGHVYGYNQGSLGVAVLGCFETTSSSCQGASPPSPAMISSLTTLLGWKSANFELNPNTIQTFCSSGGCLNLWTISGHKDAGITACPGNLVYERLQTIREGTWNNKFGWSLSAKQVDYDIISFSNYATDKSVTVRFKNTGTATWSNTTNRLLLKTANPVGRTSIFQGTGWIDAQTPAVLTEAAIALGQTGSFTFNLKSPSNANGYYWESFRLVSEGNTNFNQFFTLILQAPSYQWAFLGVSHSTGKVQMASGEAQTITLWAKNTGTATWTKSGSWPVRLGTWGPSRPSSFYHSGWLNNIRPATLVEETVAPGQIGTFTFNVSAPVGQGWYFERFNLVAEGLTWFNDTGAGAYFYVLPPGYQWEFLGVSHSTNSVFMNPGEVQTITLKAKNVSTTTWYRDSSWPVRLGTWGPSRPSSFYHGGWFNNIRPAKLLEESVAPGAIGTFGFDVFVPPAAASSGWYFERLNLVAEGLTWFNDTGAGVYFYVLPGYRWEFRGVSHSTNSVFMRPGETQTITLWAKNTGTTTWYKDTSWPVRLGTWWPSRPSSFYHGSWFNNIRPTLLNEASVAPGEIGTFTFNVTAPSGPGWYYERVNLVAEGLIWLDDTGGGFYIYVY